MKTCLFLFVSLLMLTKAYTQTAVTVDVSQRLRILTGRENGVNLDYLMDGGYTQPAIPLSTSLKNMGVKVVRYPGGEKSDNYLWSAAPWTAASPRMALLDTVNAWPTSDSRFVDKSTPELRCKPVVLDFDELMTVCKQAGTEPLIVVAYDAIYNTVTSVRPTKAQLITNATEWVRYANITKKFGIKYWMIGNESWNQPDYNGRATPDQYAADLYDFASAMKAVDPSIKIIANGISGWWPVLLKSKAVSLIDFFAISWYPIDNYTQGYETYRTNNVSMTGELDEIMSNLNDFAPAADKARIKVIMAEYNSFDPEGKWSFENNLGHALANFQMFGDVVVNPNVETSCMWNTRWVDNVTNQQHVYDALDKNGNLNANGIAMQVWGKNLLNTMVSASSNNELVKVYASYDTATKNLNLFLLNKDTTAQTATLALSNYLQQYSGSKYVFHGTTTGDKFPTFARTDTIANAAALTTLNLAPASVTVIKLAAAAAAPAIPAKLLSFTGSAVSGDALLNWQVQNDSSLLRYDVEKSMDSSSFAAIGSVNALGQATTSTYSFSDTSFSPGVPNYYRLKLVGHNGAITYSTVLKLITAIDLPTTTTFAIAPNPVDNQLQLQVQTGSAQQATVRIIDAIGRVWTFEKVGVEAGSTTIRINNLHALPHGVYWLQVQAGSIRKNIPFLKR